MKNKQLEYIQSVGRIERQGPHIKPKLIEFMPPRKNKITKKKPNTLKRAFKILLLITYWHFSIQGIRYLLNYPHDIPFYAGLAWFIANIFITYYLIKNKKLK